MNLLRVSEFAEVITGGTPSTRKSEYWDGDIPWLNSGSLNQGIVKEASKFITSAGLNGSSAKLMPPHSVLVALTGATTGLAGYLGFEACANQSVTGILPSENHIPKYVFYYVKSIRKRILDDAFGGAQPHINQQYVKDLQIPLPPLEEQKRIAVILDAADMLRAKRREALAKLDDLLQSTFLDLFGDPVTNPKGWEVKELINIAKLENGDRSSNYPSGSEVIEQGILFLSTKNIVNNHLLLETCQFISQEKFDSLSRGKLKRNDIVITLRGTLGSSAIFDCQFETGFINAQILIIRAEKVQVQYLHSLLSTQPMLDHFSRIATGAAVKQLTGKQIGALEISIPPLELQQRFAEIVSSVEEQKAKMRKHLLQLDDLFASLQQRAFRGDL